MHPRLVTHDLGLTMFELYNINNLTGIANNRVDPNLEAQVAQMSIDVLARRLNEPGLHSFLHNHKLTRKVIHEDDVQLTYKPKKLRKEDKMEDTKAQEEEQAPEEDDKEEDEDGRGPLSIVIPTTEGKVPRESSKQETSPTASTTETPILNGLLKCVVTTPTQDTC